MVKSCIFFEGLGSAGLGGWDRNHSSGTSSTALLRYLSKLFPCLGYLACKIALIVLALLPVRRALPAIRSLLLLRYINAPFTLQFSCMLPGAFWTGFANRALCQGFLLYLDLICLLVISLLCFGVEGMGCCIFVFSPDIQLLEEPEHGKVQGRITSEALGSVLQLWALVVKETEPKYYS